jgi:hypothetical protein
MNILILLANKKYMNYYKKGENEKERKQQLWCKSDKSIKRS